MLEHAEVREAVAIAREDTPGEKRLVAYYTAANELRAEKLRQRLAGALPEYMVPAAFVQLAELPLTPNGKLNRKALPAPSNDAFAIRIYEAPRGDVEVKIAAIWAEVLKLEQVSRHDNFFELGGHSLLALTLIQHLRRRGIHIDVSMLFISPVLSELSASVEEMPMEVRL